MPGKEVKDWPQYEALRREGKSKTTAARMTNASVKKRRAKKRRKH